MKYVTLLSPTPSRETAPCTRPQTRAAVPATRVAASPHRPPYHVRRSGSCIATVASELVALPARREILEGGAVRVGGGTVGVAGETGVEEGMEASAVLRFSGCAVGEGGEVGGAGAIDVEKKGRMGVWRGKFGEVIDFLGLSVEIGVSRVG